MAQAESQTREQFIEEAVEIIKRLNGDQLKKALAYALARGENNGD